MIPIHVSNAPLVTLQRDEHGVVHVLADDESAVYWGLGYAHALDRGLQLLMMRILGQGRAAELLDPSDDTVAVDRFFRKMNWAGGIGDVIAKLTPAARTVVESYAAGVNARLERKRPWELARLLRIPFEPWRAEDVVLLARMTGYLTLAQSQGEIESLLVDMVQGGVPRAMLDELFPGKLDNLDEALLQKLTRTERFVPADLVWKHGGLRAMASNNWVVSGSRTRSGHALLANDPHLEVNRLPNVWYEIALRWPEGSGSGFSIPGIPALLIGRTEHLAWGATYTFMDAIDSWVEECKDGCYRREHSWVPFRQRRERIERKKGEPVEIVFWENDHGVLDGDPHEPGFYLTTKWATSTSGSASLEAAAGILHARTVEQGMTCLGTIESAWNWVLADSNGHIGYQMSGLMPRRRDGANGLVPLAGWDPANDWNGFVAPEELPRCVDPPQGFIVTANQDLNHLGTVQPINMPMGAYRARRITQLLSARDALTTEDVRAMHMDVWSNQAHEFMHVLRPLLPDTAQGRVLSDWDCQYTADSQGAFLFEVAYHALLTGVFGTHGFGPEVARHLDVETGTFIDFYENFDRILLSESSAWFGGESRDDQYRAILAEALNVEPRRWGQRQSLQMSHMLLGGKLPMWMGFDRGPIELIGGRATVHQGQVYRSNGRTTSFAPSVRLIVDFSQPGAHTSIAGGPSDRRFSRWYCSGLQDWLAGRTKYVTPAPLPSATPTKPA